MEGEFTESERKYKELLQHLKEESPGYNVSVFHQPLETYEDILNTFVYQRQIHSSGLDLVTNFFLQDRFSEIYPTFFAPESYPFHTIKTKKELSNVLCAFVTTYMQTLHLPAQIPPSEENQHSLASFLRHYNASIELLLQGPPYANDYQVDPVLAEEWVKRQKTAERKRLARLFLENLIYIPHKRLLSEIEQCVEKTRQKLVEGAPVCFIVGTAGKSNYYVSLLFYHFWKRAGLPLDNVKSHMDSLIPGNIIDIDEMAYSGSQTINTLASVYASLIHKIKRELDLKNTENEAYQKSKNFIPIPLIESILQKSGVNYCVVRFFCSEMGKEELSKMPNTSRVHNQVKPPFHLILGTVLPSTETLFGKTNAYKLSLLFGPGSPNYPATAVYFDHKVADAVSTFLNPISFGAIPTKLLINEQARSPQYKNLPLVQNLLLHPHVLQNYFTKYNVNLTKQDPEKEFWDILYIQDANDPTSTMEFLPFLKHCSPDQRNMPTSYKNLTNYGNNGGFKQSSGTIPDKFRCPFAWYKLIDYDTGTYPKLPLPYGPSEENFEPMKGGRRRQTKKRKRLSKQKTRFTSK